MRKYKVLTYLEIAVKQLGEVPSVIWFEPFFTDQTLFTDGIYIKRGATSEVYLVDGVIAYNGVPWYTGMVNKHLIEEVPQICRIINGVLGYRLEVDGEVIPFSGGYHADYFEKLYKEMGYTVERAVDKTTDDFLRESGNQ